MVEGCRKEKRLAITAKNKQTRGNDDKTDCLGAATCTTVFENWAKRIASNTLKTLRILTASLKRSRGVWGRLGGREAGSDGGLLYIVVVAHWWGMLECVWRWEKGGGIRSLEEKMVYIYYWFYSILQQQQQQQHRITSVPNLKSFMRKYIFSKMCVNAFYTRDTVSIGRI